MTSHANQLTDRIRNELLDIDRAIERAEAAWRRAQQSSDDLYLDSVALNLQSFYSGLERIFELIATTVDRVIPEGERWHQALLRQMATDVPGVRPSVITQRSHDGLNEYRAFRHIVRNIYAFQFDPARIGKLAVDVEPLYTQVRTELLRFADFLDARA